jgi:threonine/homoserine/homoserine lactone efflux protein
MRILWTLIKVAVGLAIAIPLGVVLLGLTLGVVGTVIALAFMALKLACVALLAYGVYRVGKFFFGSGKPAPAPLRELPARDPYYDAAMRELDAEMGTNR